MGAFVIETLGIPYNVEGGWQECKKRMTDLLIQRVGKTLFPGLSGHVVLTDAGDPLTAFKYTKNCRGSGAAWDDTIFQSGIFRLEQVTPVKNLYLSGHWTKPGGSVTATLLSGLSVAKRILENEKVKSTQEPRSLIIQDMAMLRDGFTLILK
jgi:phytoene dehydrogenase-like protein